MDYLLKLDYWFNEAVYIGYNHKIISIVLNVMEAVQIIIINLMT